MSQCVPRWNVDEPPPNSSSVLPLRQCHPAGDPIDPLDYEVAELTWENGQLAFHGLVPPRTGKPTPKHPSPSVVATADTTSWNKHHRSGTLESVVHQATGSAPTAPDLDDWFSELRRSAAVAVDAIVPCRDDVADNGRLPHPDAPPRADAGRKRVRTVRGTCSSQGSAAGFLARHVDSATLVTLNGSREDEIGLTATAATATNSTSPGTEITSLGKRKTLDLDDHVSLSHTSSQTKHDSLYDEEEKATKRDVEKSSASANKSKATAIHNQSERKRRDRINQKIKTLQKLVPNSSKTDKASMLDEVIEYLKQLQAQAQMMSRMNQYRMLPMAMIAHMNLPQMGMGVGMMDLNPIGRPTLATLPPLFQYSSGFLPLATGDQRLGGPVLPDPYSTFLACQMAQQPVSFDEYSRMAALLHQHWPQA